MENIDLPKVLVIGINAWREDGDAHTLMDIYRCWTPDKLALIYCRADMPDTKVCDNYFQISESDVIKSVYKPWLKVGRVVSNVHANNSEAAIQEQKRYTKAHLVSYSWLPLVRECVWKFGHWKTAALRKFVKDFDPDILFIPIYPTVYMGWIQKYIIKLTGKPTVCYLADDNYSYDSCKNAFEYMHRWWLRRQVGPIARGSNQMFVIVDMEKEDTDRRFGTDSVILTKSIDFSNRQFEKHAVNMPLRFVYTGGLIIGRDKTLVLVADAINKINAEEGDVVAELFIYSQHQPTNEVNKHINVGASHYCGSVPHQEIKGIQEQADVVVFAEGLEGKEANIAKLSFSTKITDYLASGKCVLAIGKENIAPMDYFQRNDSAIIAHNAKEIEQQIRRIVSSPELISEYSRKAYDCAFKNHNREMMDQRFIETMCKAVKK